jgi:hypothetical protein
MAVRASRYVSMAVRSVLVNPSRSSDGSPIASASAISQMRCPISEGVRQRNSAVSSIERLWSRPHLMSSSSQELQGVPVLRLGSSEAM